MLLTAPNTQRQQHQSQLSAQHPHLTQTIDDFHLTTADPFAVADSTLGYLSSTTSPDTHRSLYAFASQQGLASLAASSPREQTIGHIRSSSLSTAASSVGDEYTTSSTSQLPDLMPSEPWALASQYTPKTFNRMPHQRESSLSSLGSAGPASPFNNSTSNPHIAISDPASDGFADVHAHDGTQNYYQLAKAMTGPGMYNTYHGMTGMEHPDMGYPSAISLQQRPRTDKSGLLPAPDFAGQNRSHPGSVASSTVGGDSPATPSLGEPLEDERRRNVKNVAYTEPPKLDRTMTDIYSDELYNPSFTITSAASSNPQQVAISPSNDLFAQRLSAANSQHLTSQSPSSSVSRDRSPFQHGSPHAPVNHDFGSNSLGSAALRFNSAHQMREREKAEQDAQMLRQQMVPRADPDTPKTISPKDAMLEFQGVDADSTFPSLFASQESTSDYGASHGSKMMNQPDPLAAFQRQAPTMPQQQQQQQQQQQGFSFMAPQQLPTNVQIPQQYPFIAHPRQHQSPPQLSSAESSGASSSNTPVHLTKPAKAGADGGTYTCTYHGCPLRFETPALLQKHKREGHRQPQGLGHVGPRRPDVVDPSSPSSLLNSQAGPHRCDRINPSTGKPCSTIFSRPYDLTRHEDTIHNARKQKVRCNLCTEEKTFSRADALTRHYRVCHPDVPLPGKFRRRGGHD